MKHNLWSLFFLLALGCQTQQKQTAAYESADIRGRQNEVLLDARSPFDYSLSHIPGSLNLLWTDFAQTKYPNQGLLEKDLFTEARRLARLGLDPQTPVIVVGAYPEDLEDMGRLAWTLKYLGFQSVRTRNMDSFQFNLTKEKTPPLANREVWKPELKQELECDLDKFWTYIDSRDRSNLKIHLIDVRSEDEYLGKVSDSVSKRIPDFGAINIPHVEFFNHSAEPESQMKSRLNSVGVNENDIILVMSKRGVRSAAVTFALQSVGFQKACNVAGGYELLLYQMDKNKR